MRFDTPSGGYEEGLGSLGDKAVVEEVLTCGVDKVANHPSIFLSSKELEWLLLIHSCQRCAFYHL